MKIKNIVRFLVSALLVSLSAFSAAQINFSVNTTDENGLPNEPEIRPLNWLNENYLKKQRTAINSLTRFKFGRSLNGNKADIPTLQRVVDNELIATDNKEMLQAMGVILGDIYVKEHKDLHWKVFTDELGPSHAVCLDDSEYCLFPITMLSRRMGLGIKPDVDKVFKQGFEAIKPQLPKLPYSD